MKPSDYMAFVDLEINQRFANPQYPRGDKDTRIVYLGPEPIQPNPNGSVPLCSHNGVRIDKIGLAYLCNIRWGAVARGNIPDEIKSLDKLAEHPDSNIEMYLSVTNHTRIVPGPTIKFDKTGRVIKVGRYKPGEKDSLETSVRAILDLIK